MIFFHILLITLHTLVLCSLQQLPPVSVNSDLCHITGPRAFVMLEQVRSLRAENKGQLSLCIIPVNHSVITAV